MKYLFAILLLCSTNSNATGYCDIIIHPNEMGELVLYSVCGHPDYQCKNCHALGKDKYNRSVAKPIETNKSFKRYYIDKYRKQITTQ